VNAPSQPDPTKPRGKAIAKKAGRNTTTWISLLETRTLVVKAYGATHKAEELLVKWLGDEQVRWSCKLLEAPSASDLATLQRGQAGVLNLIADAAHGDGDPAFWRANLEINWEESWAREKNAVGSTSAYGIRVTREDVLALLPAPSSTFKDWRRSSK
jgi:hypothetical protein